MSESRISLCARPLCELCLYGILSEFLRQLLKSYGDSVSVGVDRDEDEELAN